MKQIDTKPRFNVRLLNKRLQKVSNATILASHLTHSQHTGYKMVHKAAKQGHASQEICYSEHLPDITDIDMLFVNHIMEGNTPAEAYKLSHPDSKLNTAQYSVMGWKVRHKENVSIWLTHAKEEGLIFQAVTYSGHLNELNRLKEGAIKAGQYGAAVKAEEIRGHVGGLRVEKVENVGITATAEAIKAIVDALGPLQGAMIARSLGFDVIEDVTPDKSGK